MSSARPRPRWFFLITPQWLAWHAFAVFAAWGMLWLGDWQFHRAEGGNALSWAYTFEWPIFTLFGVVFWAKTIIDKYRSPEQTAKSDADAAMAHVESMALPAAAHTPAQHDDEADDDPELSAYNSYLAKLNSRSGTR